MDYRHGWQSHLLMVKPIVEGNRKKAKTIYEELTDWRRETLAMPTPSFEDLISKADLPPTAQAEDFTIYLVRAKASGQGVGLLAFLDGWPDERTLYIAMYYIDKAHQKMGYGSELMDSVMSLARADKKQLSIRVHQISVVLPTFFYDRGFKIVERIEPDDAILSKKR